jgi:hypothetical protein
MPCEQVGTSTSGEIFGSPTEWARFLPMYLSGILFFLYRDRIPHRNSLAILAGICLAFPILLRFESLWPTCFATAGCYLLLWFS